MSNRPLTKAEEHEQHQLRFMKTREEKEQLKAAKAAWKKSQPKKNEQTKG